MEVKKIFRDKLILFNILLIFNSCGINKNVDVFNGVCINTNELKFENIQMDINRQAKKSIKNLLKQKFREDKIEYIFYNKKDKHYYVKLSNFTMFTCLKISEDYQIVDKNHYMFET